MKLKMLGGVFGGLGSGKTLFLVYLAYKNPDIPVFANFRINLKNCELIEPKDLIGMEYEKALILLDEAYTWLESRVSSSKLNRYVSYILFQSRKRGLDFIITAQLLSTIDIRFKDLCDIYFYAERVREGFRYTMLSKDLRMKTFILPYKFAEKKLFGIYNTYEVVMPFDIEELKTDIIAQTNKEEMNKIVDEIVEEIKRQYKNVTHAIIMDYLVRTGKPLSLEPLIYVRLKHKRQ